MLCIKKLPSYSINRFLFILQRRHKSKKEHWAVERRKKTPSMKALEHFDDFYRKVFGSQWPSVRLALLSPHKYCAVVNNFGDTEQTVTYFQNQGALDLKTHLELGRKLADENLIREDDDFPNAQKLDERIKKLAFSKQQQEAEEMYPPTEEGVQLAQHQSASNKEEEVVQRADYNAKDFSLEASKKLSQIDESRNVSPALGLSAGALYEFIPATKLKGLEDRVLDSEHYSYYSGDTDFPLTVKKEFDLNYPDHLKVFMYERGNVTSFESPKRGSTGVFNYYLMDGGSVLPVLALGIEPGDTVLDMCAAPGGKSLVMLQTLHTGRLVCNDVQESRTKRIHSVLNQYLYDLPKWKDQIEVTKSDGRGIEQESMFDKVLVDVPCTTDRHSLHEDDNSIFNVARLKERLRLPELQSQLLMNALKLVKPGGTVVYSTCSLSPIQNDGVVHMALQKIWEETKVEVEVRDLSPALQGAKSVFKFGDNIGLRYGHLVLPFLPCNFGPLYFCKIVRTK
ncbi:hypothetical protein R5R35_003978 [Gryllus longicercus]|uniref:NOL1/NOP2/Sun domain family member 4 n=1 Tax=Gryllus longicercus TaxID=2509291 RepID=A0AAN9VS85_9ORTH